MITNQDEWSMRKLWTLKLDDGTCGRSKNCPPIAVDGECPDLIADVWNCCKGGRTIGQLGAERRDVLFVLFKKRLATLDKPDSYR